MTPTTEMYDRLKRHVVVALDVDTLDQALELSTRLSGRVDKFKIGSRLFTKYGPQILDRLGASGAQVFLDLKFHDIPSVVGDACKNAADHPAVFLMTVHAVGGRAMLEAAVAGVRASAADERFAGALVSESRQRTARVVAVTALTSLSRGDLSEIGVDRGLDAWIGQLAHTALEAGVDGLVCSAQEAAALRREFGEAPLLVTPGIRLPGSSDTSADDQARVLAPADALRAGSSLLVIGRPVYQAADPVAVIDQIARSLSASAEFSGN